MKPLLIRARLVALEPIRKPVDDVIRRDMHDGGRPLDEIIEQYLTTVQSMHLQFLEPSKRYTDVIVPRGGHDIVAVEMIGAGIQRRRAAEIA